MVKQGRLLIADAHQNMLEGVRRLLSDLFEMVLMVADEDSLFQAVAGLKPDLVIVDISLPVADSERLAGAENILRRLVRRCDSCSPARIIALSVHDEVEIVREALSAGARGFVLKRSAVVDLIPAIREVLEGRVYVSPGVQTDCAPCLPHSA